MYVTSSLVQKCSCFQDICSGEGSSGPPPSADPFTTSHSCGLSCDGLHILAPPGRPSHSMSSANGRSSRVFLTHPPRCLHLSVAARRTNQAPIFQTRLFYYLTSTRARAAITLFRTLRDVIFLSMPCSLQVHARLERAQLMVPRCARGIVTAARILTLKNSADVVSNFITVSPSIASLCEGVARSRGHHRPWKTNRRRWDMKEKYGSTRLSSVT